MANPQISFRLTPYQLARGLKIIRRTEPAYTPSSISQLVKAIYITSVNNDRPSHNQVTDADIIELISIGNNKAPAMSLSEFQQTTSTEVTK